ncbi:MAG: hypothetical protein H8E79_05600 [Desulfobulbaceae bacterium]|uniref:Uncharacterized protein n=1 Tax=Candidatus Desulfatifera sulfidica TaxID=2841691 RepID=A0A8J6N6K0_9BACT|nr:hypothetical protein [Candidatus Desulfatifera sulfidica]
MELRTRSAGRNTFVKALATVTVVDAAGVPVAGATVHGSWSGATFDIDQGVSGTDGIVMLESDEVKNPAVGTSFSFTVTGVEAQGGMYSPEENVETNDSIVY